MPSASASDWLPPSSRTVTTCGRRAEPAATPEWIAANVDEMLATMERLYAVAAESDQPGAIEFLDRMRWLPPLLADLDRATSLEG